MTTPSKNTALTDPTNFKEILDIIEDSDRVYICGNGGSAVNASHLSMHFPNMICLTDNVATMIAFANDLCFEDIFVQQLRNLVNPGDVVVGISASGNSANVVKGIEYAKKCGAETIGFLGFKTGGKLHDLVDYEITVQDEHYGRSEDVHLMIVHLITNYLTEELKNKAKII